ncbi:HAMP domain-containing protein [Trinickia violacea]|uniref:HAMP domain-containing protein n=1 Tax=Trinickia violacea TaxID=2571746 RepID=A0A4P8J0M1_9BURK|nr:methyl-accepting chemotaxis protein [Trinickia violacea]QCP53443.1 HAMP domain-containing protein [Trinickia violacea]
MSHFTQTIRFKIILALGVCGILLLATGLFGISGLSKLNVNLIGTYSGNVLPLANLAEIQAAQLEIRVKLRTMLEAKTADGMAKPLSKVEGYMATIDKKWPDYYPSGVSNDTERAVADKIAHDLVTFKSQVADQMAALKSGDLEKAGNLINAGTEISESLHELISQDIKINVDEAKQFVDDSESTFDRLLWTAIGLVIAGVVVVVGASVYLLRAISKPLGKAVDIANHIASGRLDNDIAVDEKGEFGMLLEALKRMEQQLGDTVRGIRTATESVTVASREIASGNTDLSARTEEQAASLEETASSMTQLTETVKQNADNARQANALAVSATDMADTGNDAVQGMVTTIGQISGSSSKISEITGVIEGIAFQTNILALNAAVEAARAGEQGRGFAVVASEVRSLAQRSAAAAKEIKELIGSSVAMIHDGAQQASEVGETMGRVKQAIKQVSDIVGEIAAASEEQSTGIEQVNQAVTQMDDVTQQNAALVEQAAAAAQSLEEQALKLGSMLAVFKLSETGVVPVRADVVPGKPRVASASVPPLRRPAPAAKVAVAAPKRAAPRAIAAPAPASEPALANDDWQSF